MVMIMKQQLVMDITTIVIITLVIKTVELLALVAMIIIHLQVTPAVLISAACQQQQQQQWDKNEQCVRQPNVNGIPFSIITSIRITTDTQRNGNEVRRIILQSDGGGDGGGGVTTRWRLRR